MRSFPKISVASIYNLAPIMVQFEGEDTSKCKLYLRVFTSRLSAVHCGHHLLVLLSPRLTTLLMNPVTEEVREGASSVWTSLSRMWTILLYIFSRTVGAGKRILAICEHL